MDPPKTSTTPGRGPPHLEVSFMDFVIYSPGSLYFPTCMFERKAVVSRYSSSAQASINVVAVLTVTNNSPEAPTVATLHHSPAITASQVTT